MESSVMNYLYVMDTNVKPRFKIGVSNNPKRRRREIERTIQQQHGKDKIVKLLWQKECQDAYDVELQTHVYLKPFNDQFYKTNGSTEWFNASLKKYIQLLVQRCVGINKNLFHFLTE